MTFDVKITGFEGMQKRNLQRTLKLSLKGMLYHWFVTYFRHHFTRAAFYKYPGVYKRRGRRKRGRRPNVDSGAMKRALESSFRVTGTPKLMRATMSGPAYTYVKSPGHPDKVRELTEISRTEERRLAEVFEKTLVDLINADTTKERLHIRG